MKQLFYNNASRNRLRSNKEKKSLLQLCRVYQVVAFYQKTMRNRFLNRCLQEFTTGKMRRFVLKILGSLKLYGFKIKKLC